MKKFESKENKSCSSSLSLKILLYSPSLIEVLLSILLSSSSSFLVSSFIFSKISLVILEELFILSIFGLFISLLLLELSESEFSLAILSIKTKFLLASNNFNLSVVISGELPLFFLKLILPKYFNLFISFFFWIYFSKLFFLLFMLSLSLICFLFLIKSKKFFFSFSPL